VRRAGRKQIMTIQEAADRLHVHPTSLSKLVKEGELIHGAKIAGKWDIPDSEVSRLLETRYEFHPEYIDVAALAERIGKAEKTVRKYIQDNFFKAVTDPLCMTRKLFIRRDQIAPLERVLKQRPI
jgi:excisionase family DNA binding protein